MPTYIALLRGINVSGQKKIKMAELRAHLAELDFDRIRTYIQSGNILFECRKLRLPNWSRKIADLIRAKYGFEVPVLVKEPEDFRRIIDNNPYRDDPEKDEKRLYLTFLAAVPTQEYLDGLSTVDYHPEEFRIIGKDLYFYSPNGYGRAKMNNNFFEKKLKVAATTRNWRTIHKLLEMSKASQ